MKKMSIILTFLVLMVVSCGPGIQHRNPKPPFPGIDNYDYWCYAAIQNMYDKNQIDYNEAMKMIFENCKKEKKEIDLKIRRQ